MTSMNNSFNNNLRQQIYSKKVKAPSTPQGNQNVVPIPMTESPHHAHFEENDAILSQLYTPEEQAFQAIPPQATPLQGIGSFQPQHFPGGALYGTNNQASTESTGMFEKLKSAMIDLFFEDVPVDQPIGLSRLSHTTFNGTPDKPAASFYSAPMPAAQDFRLNPFKKS